MVSVNFQNNVKVYQSGGTNRVQTAPLPVHTNPISDTQKSTPSFKADGYRSAITVRTQLTTSDEKKKYKELTT